MLNTKQSLMPDRGVIAIYGDDAREFLQGLITNDIHKVGEGVAVFAALLSPQGKFLYDFFIVEHEGKLLLDIAKPVQDELIKRLSMYKLRSKVEITAMPKMMVAADWKLETQETGKLENQIRFIDPRRPELGMRIIGAELVMKDTGEYEQHRLNLAVPEGSKDLTQNRSLPIEWAYDKLNAIDFNKGCYVGQEVTARSKHRATLHKMIHRVEADVTLPLHGTVIMAGEREVGTMATSMGNKGLAMLNIETVNSGVEITSNGITLNAKLPDWVVG